MSSKRRTIGLCCLLLGLCAAFSAHAQSADASVGEGMPSTVVAKQGNAIVTLADIDAFAARIPEKERPGFFDNPTRLQNLILQLLSQKQLADEARKADLDKNPAVRGQIDIATDEVLSARGVSVHETGRGGDITYHGPGQIVGYPIIDLQPDRCDVHRYVRDLEEVLIRTAADYDVGAHRVEGLTGVWVGREKLAAIGVRIARWVTSHGFALNVTTDLQFFDLIVPCGIADRGVTSLARLVGHPVDRAEVEDRLLGHFAVVFGRMPVPECDHSGLTPVG